MLEYEIHSTQVVFTGVDSSRELFDKIFVTESH